ncbi:CWC16 protein [Xylariaceae sp. FL0804]|nr:CWC16 protein [Xylariaceae sp. FL0804]
MQGFNMGRYVPPDAEGTASGNQLHGKHRAAARAPATVRFEMPFAVWCGHCARPTLIGQGVRFNATKARVGWHHSTPVWAFRMRHADCGGALEVRTDPANTAYVVAEGGRRRDTGLPDDDDPRDTHDAGRHYYYSHHDDDDGPSSSSGTLAGGAAPPILTPAERARLRSDAFARFERTIDDRAALAATRARVAGLAERSGRAWEDPYARNRELRAAFRVGRHERERRAAADGDLRARLGLGDGDGSGVVGVDAMMMKMMMPMPMPMPIAPELPDDARRAALVDFDAGDREADARAALAQPLFGPGTEARARYPGGSGGGGSGSSSGSSRKQGPSAAATAAASNGVDHNKSSHNNTKKKQTKNKQLKADLAAVQARQSIVSEIVGNTRASRDPFLQQRRPMGPGAGAGAEAFGAPTTTTRTASPRGIQGIKRKRRPTPGETGVAVGAESEEADEDEEEEEQRRPATRKRGGRSPAAAARAAGTGREVESETSAGKSAVPAALVEYDSD